MGLHQAAGTEHTELARLGDLGWLGRDFACEVEGGPWHLAFFGILVHAGEPASILLPAAHSSLRLA